MSITRKSRPGTSVSEMPPPPSRTIRGPKVVDEDTYVEAMASIIRRQFFPENTKLRNQIEYLDALDSGDPERIQSVLRRLPTATRRTNTTPGATPLPQHAVQAADASLSNPESFVAEDGSTVDTSLSLDQFLARYTSEDFASFEDIRREDEAAWRRRYWWVFEQERKAARAQILDSSHTKRITGPGVGAFTANAHRDTRPATLDTWKARALPGLHFTPNADDAADTCGVAGENPSGRQIARQELLRDGGASAAESAERLRPGAAEAVAADAMALATKSGSDQAPALITEHGHKAQEAARARTVARQRQRHREAFRSAPPTIQCEATRFSTEAVRQHRAEAAGLAQPATEPSRVLAVREDGVADPTSGKDVPDLPGNRASDGRKFGFVATPVIEPGVDASPLMTWGEVAGTPLLLDPSLGDLSVPQRFEIKPPSRREAIGHALHAQNVARRRSEGGSGSSSGRKRQRALGDGTPHGTPRGTPALFAAGTPQNTPGPQKTKKARPRSTGRHDPLAGMSPAARRLASQLRASGTSRSGSAAGFGEVDTALRKSYTPQRKPELR